MLTPFQAKRQRSPHGMAKRLPRNGNGESTSNMLVMAMVICEQCGARFAITHDPAFCDAALAQRQAVWLKDRFVWDHIQENKHPGSIQFPSLPEVSSRGANGA